MLELAFGFLEPHGDIGADLPVFPRVGNGVGSLLGLGKVATGLARFFLLRGDTGQVEEYIKLTKSHHVPSSCIRLLVLFL